MRSSMWVIVIAKQALSSQLSYTHRIDNINIGAGAGVMKLRYVTLLRLTERPHKKFAHSNTET